MHLLMFHYLININYEILDLTDFIAEEDMHFIINFIVFVKTFFSDENSLNLLHFHNLGILNQLKNDFFNKYQNL